MNRKTPLKFALVGCGLMGGHYADVFGGLGDISLAACCDPTPSKLARFAREKGFDRSYLDFRELIRNESIDGLANVTPDHLHAEVLLAALDRGIPLITEKPLAGQWDECRAVRRAAESSAVPILVNFSKRNTAAVAAARTLLAQGTIGELIRIDASYRQGWVFSRDWGDWEDVSAWTWRLCSATAPQGVLADLGSHLVDILRHITGREVDRASGGVLNVIDKGRADINGHALDSPDVAMANLELRGRVPARLLCSRVDIGEKDRLAVVAHGTRGRMVLDLAEDRRSVELTMREDVVLPDDVLAPGSAAPAGRLAAGETARVTVGRPETNYIRFARLMAGEPVEHPSLEDGFRTQAVLEAIQASVEDGGGSVPLETWYE